MSSPINTTGQRDNPFQKKVYDSWRRFFFLQDGNKKVEGRGKADATEVGQLAAEAIIRGSGQRKEQYEQNKVQQVWRYQHGDHFGILQE